MTGGGSWFNSLGDSGVSAWGSGVSGDDWVNFNYSCDFGGSAQVAATVGLSGACSGRASAGDGVSYVGSPYFSVSIFGDVGSLELFDSTRDVLASIPLTGYVVPMQQSILFNEADGTFAIVPSPEPGTIILFATAGLAIGVRRWTRSCRQ